MRTPSDEPVASTSVRARGTLRTPIGELLVEARADGVTGVWFAGRWPSGASADAATIDAPDDAARRMLDRARTELAEYFAGARREFTVPCVTVGTGFQTRVWTALRDIPFGALASYRDVADAIGDRKSVRAVGAANGRNPVPIIVPCHRVIGADGSLTGFGGGMAAKRWLLEHEGALPASLLP